MGRFADDADRTRRAYPARAAKSFRFPVSRPLVNREQRPRNGVLRRASNRHGLQHRSRGFRLAGGSLELHLHRARAGHHILHPRQSAQQRILRKRVHCASQHENAQLFRNAASDRDPPRHRDGVLPGRRVGARQPDSGPVLHALDRRCLRGDRLLRNGPGRAIKRDLLCALPEHDALLQNQGLHGERPFLQRLFLNLDARESARRRGNARAFVGGCRRILVRERQSPRNPVFGRARLRFALLHRPRGRRLDDGNDLDLHRARAEHDLLSARSRAQPFRRGHFVGFARLRDHVRGAPRRRRDHGAFLGRRARFLEYWNQSDRDGIFRRNFKQRRLLAAKRFERMGRFPKHDLYRAAARYAVLRPRQDPQRARARNRIRKPRIDPDPFDSPDGADSGSRTQPFADGSLGNGRQPAHDSVFRRPLNRDGLYRGLGPVQRLGLGGVA